MQGNVSDRFFVVRTINYGTMTMIWVCESIGSPSLLTYASFFNKSQLRDHRRAYMLGAWEDEDNVTRFGMLTGAVGVLLCYKCLVCVNDFDGHHDRPRRPFEPCPLSHKQAYLGITIGNEFQHEAEDQESGMQPGM